MMCDNGHETTKTCFLRTKSIRVVDRFTGRLVYSNVQGFYCEDCIRRGWV